MVPQRLQDILPVVCSGCRVARWLTALDGAPLPPREVAAKLECPLIQSTLASHEAFISTCRGGKLLLLCARGACAVVREPSRVDVGLRIEEDEGYTGYCSTSVAFDTSFERLVFEARRELLALKCRVSLSATSPGRESLGSVSPGLRLTSVRFEIAPLTPPVIRVGIAGASRYEDRHLDYHLDVDANAATVVVEYVRFGRRSRSVTRVRLDISVVGEVAGVYAPYASIDLSSLRFDATRLCERIGLLVWCARLFNDARVKLLVYSLAALLEALGCSVEERGLGKAERVIDDRFLRAYCTLVMSEVLAPWLYAGSQA